MYVLFSSMPEQVVYSISRTLADRLLLLLQLRIDGKQQTTALQKPVVEHIAIDWYKQALFTLLCLENIYIQDYLYLQVASSGPDPLRTDQLEKLEIQVKGSSGETPPPPNQPQACEGQDQQERQH